MVEAQRAGGNGDGDEVVILKKYGNRRLYDTSSSRYVTIGEVEAMVQRGVDIQVFEAKTGDDITKEILVQLLLERDSARASLPTGLLKQAVRLANSPLKDGLVKAMQEGLDAFMQSQRTVLDAQRALTSQLGQLTPWIQPGATPAALWNPFAPPAPPPAGHSKTTAKTQSAPTTTTTSAGDVDALRAELSQTQTLVRQLLEREFARGEGATSRSEGVPAPGEGAPARPAPTRTRKKPAASTRKSVKKR